MAIDYSHITKIFTELGGWGIRLIILAALMLAVYAVIFVLNKKKKYNWVVRIFNRDATGQVIQQPDDRGGGIFLDKKTSYRLFLLKKYKFGLDPDDIPYILTSGGQKIVYLLQTGLKNFQYMKPIISNDKELKFNVQDEDVAWAINAWERYKNPYKNKFMEQIMPFIGMAFVFLCVVVAIYYLTVKAGFNADLLRELSDSARAISNNMAKASLGTVVID